MSPPEITAVLVDDEPLARDELSFLLEQCGGVLVVGQAGHAAEALPLVEAEQPDVVFVDLRMPGPDGVALAEAIRNRVEGVEVVVVSAHDDGAVRAFEARVLDYLLKPVRLERLRATVERLRSRPRKRESGSDEGPLDRLAVRRKGAYVVVDIADVSYFVVEDELVWAVTATDRFALDLTLAAVARRLPEDVFFRSHRSYLVRLANVRGIEPVGTGAYDLLLDPPAGTRVPLARERVKSLRERIPFAG